MRWLSKRWAGLAAFLGWLFAILATFYAVQKPLGPEQAQALARALGELALAAFSWAVAWSWGRQVLPRVAPAILPRAYLHLASLALGLGGLALLTLLLGLAGTLTPAVGWGVAAFLALPLARDLAALVRRALAGEDPLSGLRGAVQAASRGEKALALYMGAAFAGSLFLALAPPLGWDSLFYHLPGPRWYLTGGRIQPLPLDVPHLHYPCLVEMLFLWQMLLGGERAAVLVHWGYGLLLTGAVTGLAQRQMGSRAAPWALAAFGSMPMVFALASWAYTDLALATYLTLGLWGVLLWREEGRRAYLVLGGMHTGLALGVKYTAAPGALGLFALVSLWAWRGSRHPLREVLSFAAATFLAALPWYLKAWAFAGNPAYPFLFGGAGWDAWRAQWYAEAGTGIGGDVRELVALPLTVTLGLRDVNYYDGRMGPLFLAFLPLLVWAVLRVRPRLQALWGCLLVAGVQALAWTAGVIWSHALFQSRLLLPALAVLAPAYGWALAQLPPPAHPGKFSLRRFLGVVVGLVLLLNLTEQALDLVARRPLAVLTGQESEEAYLLRNLGKHYAAMQALETETPPEARVLFFWEPRSYYSPRPCQPDAILDLWPRLVLRHKRSEALADAVRAEGWTHILWHEEGASFVRRSGRTAGMEEVWPAWESLKDCCLRPVWQAEDGAYALYALR